MANPTDSDFRKVGNHVTVFNDTLIGTQPGAMEAFRKKLIWAEKMKIGTARLNYEFNKNAAPKIVAEKLVLYCESLMPSLANTFGEQAMLAALPKGARTEDTAQLCEGFGGHLFAALIRKSLPNP